MVLPPTPAERPQRPGRARVVNIVLAVVTVVATIGALALAAAAPSLASSAPAPRSTGLAQVYNMRLIDDPSNWDVGHGCTFEQGGLHATQADTASLCAFLPSQQSNLTGSGFYLTTTVGPAAAVSGQQEPCIALQGDGGYFSLAFNQTGGFELSDNADQPCVLQGATGVLPETVAWHADGLTPNVISLHYIAESNQMLVYVNGQEIASVVMTHAAPQQISLGASGSGEAVFTSFALYSGS